MDRYENVQGELIRRKQKGREAVRAPEPEDTNVIDLMAALQKSLRHKTSAPARKAKHKGAS